MRKRVNNNNSQLLTLQVVEAKRPKLLPLLQFNEQQQQFYNLYNYQNLNSFSQAAKNLFKFNLEAISSNFYSTTPAGFYEFPRVTVVCNVKGYRDFPRLTNILPGSSESLNPADIVILT